MTLHTDSEAEVDLVLKDVQDVFLDFVHQVQLEEDRNKIRLMVKAKQ